LQEEGVEEEEEEEEVQPEEEEVQSEQVPSEEGEVQYARLTTGATVQSEGEGEHDEYGHDDDFQ
jgi:hypothetical protein